MKRKNVELLPFSIFIILFSKNIFTSEILAPSQIRFTGSESKIEKFLEIENKKFRYFLTGQVAAAGSYDSNRFMGLVQDAVIFYPLPKKLDSSGLDINDKDQADMFALNASIKTLFVGPDLWKAKVLGRFEVGFIGIKTDIAGIMNLASAYTAFLWKNSEFRFGHFYHPLALDNLYPTPISGSEGAGYDPIRRGPFLRFTHKINKIRFVLALSKVFDIISSTRAAMPDLFGQFIVKPNENFIFGVGMNLHAEVPRLQTDKGYKESSTINGITAFAYARMMLLNFLVKARFTYIENGNNFGIMGSYSAVEQNNVTQERIYTPMRAAAMWTELVFVKSKLLEPAVFIGFTKNLGAARPIQKGYIDESGDCNSLINIDSNIPGAQFMFQISPRLRMQVKDFIFGFEFDYYRAAFARSSNKPGWQNDYDCYGKVIKAKPASDKRLIFSAVYTF